MSAQDVAIRRIAEARATNAWILDLGDLELEALPEDLRNLPTLHVLTLGQVAVHDGDDEIEFVREYRRPVQEFSDLSPLASLTNLQTLDLESCKGCSDLGPLASLKKLETLNLSWCDGITDLSPLRPLTSLQSLDLSLCKQITNLDALTCLANLHRLELFGCAGITQLEALSSLTALQILGLSGCDQITNLGPLASLAALQVVFMCECGGITDLGPLSRLTALKTLNLHVCAQITDLGPLASLVALQVLDLGFCVKITELSPLATLTNLHTLRLCECISVRHFGPIRDLLPQLTHLSLFDCCFEDLDPALCGNSFDENVLSAVRAHYADLAFGSSDEAELRVMILGNGGVGKTQLCNRLCGRPYDPGEPSTHGVQISYFDVSIPGRTTPIGLNLWDFGGQDIYHGSHALFLHGGAIFLIVWTPQTEEGEYKYGDGEVQVGFRHRPLVYWLEYIRSLAGDDNLVLVIQGKCDGASDQSLIPGPFPQLSSVRFLDFSAQVEEKVTNLRSALQQAAGELLDRRPVRPVGKGRVRLRQHLRRMLEEDRRREKPRHRTLTQAAFYKLCDKNGEIDNPEETLKYLHRSGVLFWRPDVFDGRIILDQSWALTAIYAIFHRAKVLPILFGKGRFTREMLGALVWKDRPVRDQETFLGMMVSCGICFRCREVNPGTTSREWEYIAPELLPQRDSPEVERELTGGRIPQFPAPAHAEVRYQFLHEGILRRFLSWLGYDAGDSAVYWKFGCWFYDPKVRGGVLIDSHWGDDSERSQQGAVTLDAWGEQAAQLLKPLVEKLIAASFMEKPEVSFTGVDAHDVTESENRSWPAADLLLGRNTSIFSDPDGKGSPDSRLMTMLALVKLLLQMRPGDPASSRHLQKKLAEQDISPAEGTVRSHLRRLEARYGKLLADGRNGFAKILLPRKRQVLREAKFDFCPHRACVITSSSVFFSFVVSL